MISLVYCWLILILTTWHVCIVYICIKSVLLFVLCMSVYFFKLEYFNSAYNCSPFLGGRALCLGFSYFVCSGVCIRFGMTLICVCLCYVYLNVSIVCVCKCVC